MTAKEYLQQAYRLDKLIHSVALEAAELRDAVTNIASPKLDEHYDPNRSTEAPFVRVFESVWELEGKVKANMNKLVRLREQITRTIDSLDNADEKMVLRYRYLHHYTWEQISRELNGDSRTVRRWHQSALRHIVIPENPILI